VVQINSLSRDVYVASKSRGLNFQLLLITGGSQGLGEAMGIEFAKKGADIVLVSRSEEKLKLAAAKLEVFLHCRRLTNTGSQRISCSEDYIL
jgi:NADP-dependent 3-hydroxy acid dehydrogenase YdfG